MARLEAFGLLIALTWVHAVAAAAELPSDQRITNSLGMQLLRIEPGEFLMGSAAEPPRDQKEWEAREADESPAHRVTISRPFCLGVHEVTNAQYEQFDPDHARFRGRRGASAADDEPVTFVTWQQATDFPPNAWGLHDVHGNVAEWCADWYGPYAAEPQTDPVGRAEGEARVTRGWSYLATTHPRGAAHYCRSANRSGHLPDYANAYTGFRVALGERPASRPLLPAVPLCRQNVRQDPVSVGGPDANVPYFVDFNREQRAPYIAPDAWGPVFRHWNHFSTVCVCPNGDVLAVWYTTVQEEGRELAQAASRLRAGSDRWEPASSFFDVPDVNDHAPVLLRDGHRIYHFCTQSLRAWDDASEIMRISEDNGATWSPPRIILSRDDPDHLSQPCSAVATRGGVLLLACDGDNHDRERLLRSVDRGRTWTVAKGDLRQAAGNRYVIHPALAERSDGTLLCFLRGPDPMPLLVSSDLGDTWQEQPTPFPGVTVGQKPAALRLASGAILLASADNGQRLVGGGTFAALSLDGGRTWPHVRRVEGPGGYLSVAQAASGVIYLFGPNMGRPACAAFNEAWLRERN